MEGVGSVSVQGLALAAEDHVSDIGAWDCAIYSETTVNGI